MSATESWLNNLKKKLGKTSQPERRRPQTRLCLEALEDRLVPAFLYPADSGFETPSIGTGWNAYQYDPSGTAWTFAGGAGVAGNFSALNSGTNGGYAPEGTQVAFLQGAGSSISQSINTPTAGSYAVSFWASQRYGNASVQSIGVLVDGNLVETVIPY